MPDYNPKFPHELLDAQLDRASHESEESKAMARGDHSHHALDSKASADDEKISYNNIPGE